MDILTNQFALGKPKKANSLELPDSGQEEPTGMESVQQFLADDIKMFFAQEADRRRFLAVLEKDGLVFTSVVFTLHPCHPGLFCWSVCSQDSIRALLDGLRDGWSLDALGELSRREAEDMSWTGRQSMRRLIKQIAKDLDSFCFRKLCSV